MVFIVTAIALLVGIIAHRFDIPPFLHPVSVPIAGLVAMCAMGILARLVPTRRRALVDMVPEWVPKPTVVVWLTGLLELAGGIGLLIEATRPWAAICLGLLLVTMFPANVVDARRAGDKDGTTGNRLLRRGSEQVAFVLLCVSVLVIDHL